MWVPTSEAQIEQAISDGLLREGPSFDAKAELPRAGRNKDLAKDICAMTIEGGVLLYGVGGDDSTRPDRLAPIGLAGAAERVDLVAQTAIAEPPYIEISDFRSERAPDRGYLVVVIPPSPRAPHMVTLDGDNRYWARGATGNRALSEAEVARLYALRERWDTDANLVLDEALETFPFPAGDDGAVCVAARLLGGAPDPLARVAGGDRDRALEALRLAAAAADPYRDQGDASLSDAYQIVRRGADAWGIDAGREPAFPYGVRLEITRNGVLRYWAKPITHEVRGRRLMLERSVTRHVTQLAAALGALLENAGLAGMVDIGVAVLGIETAIAASAAQAFSPREYGEAMYRATDRFSAAELRADPRVITARLVAPLYEAFSRPGYAPFADAG